MMRKLFGSCRNVVLDVEVYDAEAQHDEAEDTAQLIGETEAPQTQSQPPLIPLDTIVHDIVPFVSNCGKTCKTIAYSTNKEIYVAMKNYRRLPCPYDVILRKEIINDNVLIRGEKIQINATSNLGVPSSPPPPRLSCCKTVTIPSGDNDLSVVKPKQPKRLWKKLSSYFLGRNHRSAATTPSSPPNEQTIAPRGGGGGDVDIRRDNCSNNEMMYIVTQASVRENLRPIHITNIQTGHCRTILFSKWFYTIQIFFSPIHPHLLFVYELALGLLCYDLREKISIRRRRTRSPTAASGSSRATRSSCLFGLPIWHVNRLLPVDKNTRSMTTYNRLPIYKFAPNGILALIDEFDISLWSYYNNKQNNGKIKMKKLRCWRQDIRNTSFSITSKTPTKISNDNDGNNNDSDNIVFVAGIYRGASRSIHLWTIENPFITTSTTAEQQQPPPCIIIHIPDLMNPINSRLRIHNLQLFQCVFLNGSSPETIVTETTTSAPYIAAVVSIGARTYIKVLTCPYGDHVRTIKIPCCYRIINSMLIVSSNGEKIAFAGTCSLLTCNEYHSYLHLYVFSLVDDGSLLYSNTNSIGQIKSLQFTDKEGHNLLVAIEEKTTNTNDNNNNTGDDGNGAATTTTTSGGSSGKRVTFCTFNVDL